MSGSEQVTGSWLVGNVALASSSTSSSESCCSGERSAWIEYVPGESVATTAPSVSSSCSWTSMSVRVPLAEATRVT